MYRNVLSKDIFNLLIMIISGLTLYVSYTLYFPPRLVSPDLPRPSGYEVRIWIQTGNAENPFMWHGELSLRFILVIYSSPT